MIHLFYFLMLYVQVLLLLLILGLNGFFLVSPFCSKKNLVIFSSPIAGMMGLGLGCAVFYGAIGFSFKLALGLSLAIGIYLSFSAVKIYPLERPLYFNFAMRCLLLLVAGVVYITNYHSVHYLQPTLVYMDGSDQLGYANVAYWILHHSIHEPPLLSPQHIYQSWPAFAFEGDKRFGTYYFYAAILWLKNNALSHYLYDFIIGVAFCAGVLGVVGVYANRKRTIFLLTFALLFSSLLGFGYAGYLGKIIGYFSLLTLAGLSLKIILADYLADQGIKIVHLILLTLGMASLYPGNPITFIFMGTLFLATCLKTLEDWKMRYPVRYQFNRIKLAFIITAIPIIFMGILALPQLLLAQKEQVSSMFLNKVIPVTYGLLTYDNAQSFLHPRAAYNLGSIIVFFCCICALYALRKRNYLATSFLIFPLVLVWVTFYKQEMSIYYVVYQLAGVGYLLSVLALVNLLEAPDITRFQRRFFTFVFILMIFGAFGNFTKMKERYASQYTPLSQIMVPQQMQALMQLTAGKNMLMDTHDDFSIFLMNEYAFQDSLNLFWTKRAWETVMAYRPWRVPKIPDNTHWVLEATPDKPEHRKNCVVKYHTNQFDLFYCEQ